MIEEIVLEPEDHLSKLLETRERAVSLFKRRENLHLVLPARPGKETRSSCPQLLLREAGRDRTIDKRIPPREYLASQSRTVEGNGVSVRNVEDARHEGAAPSLPHLEENWPKALDRLRVFGYGDIILRDSYVVVKNPFISNLTFLTGFLEGVLGTTLEPKITTSPLVFEISH